MNSYSKQQIIHVVACGRSQQKSKIDLFWVVQICQNFNRPVTSFLEFVSFKREEQDRGELGKFTT